MCVNTQILSSPDVVREHVPQEVDGSESSPNERGLTHLSGEHCLAEPPQSVVGGHEEEGTVKQAVLGTILIILVFNWSGGGKQHSQSLSHFPPSHVSTTVSTIVVNFGVCNITPYLGGVSNFNILQYIWIKGF